jgi:hypothetical protein
MSEKLVIKQRWFGAALLVVACGGGSTAEVAPSKSASGAVQAFMQAVADSNLMKMAALWGTSRGPASKTRQPSDYERRLAIMQSYLRNDSYRLTSDLPETAARRAVQVEIRRQTCTWNVPFVAIKTGDGSWLVNQVDLTAAGNPARPCLEGEPRDSTPQG